MLEIMFAAKLFPWNRILRTKAGYVALVEKGSTKLVEQALLADPFSADLTFFLAGRYAQEGRDLQAQALLLRFHRLAPLSRIGLN
jgi:hypothetical protein